MRAFARSLIIRRQHQANFGSYWASGNDGYRQIFEQIGRSTLQKPNIVTNVLDQERDRQIARLKTLTGRPEQASGAADSLQIIAVAFEGMKAVTVQAPGPMARPSVEEDGYRRLSLDLGQVPGAAVVIIADQPIRWRLQGLTPASRPRVGFEGYAAFDVLGGQPGSLAGFRIGAFGGVDFARAVDPTEGEASIRQTFCASLQSWADHFGLPFDAARFTLLLNPGQIAPNRSSTLSDGEIVKTMYSADLDRLCKLRANR
ncbi:hypothetical protein [Bradyrhizobium sp.]|jgi:hypothetical protein|uniref:hypothetical protein n=1 Tax=Bradyrhizobium sp. TaxID=376 RepID=UPI002E0304F3|nr:hypothetical protein [Bradyrhizobium sp.]